VAAGDEIEAGWITGAAGEASSLKTESNRGRTVEPSPERPASRLGSRDLQLFLFSSPIGAAFIPMPKRKP
jgi:hypothetical protein